MNIEIFDSKTAFEVPRSKVVEMKAQRVLCSSTEEKNTGNFTYGRNNYDDDYWN